MKTLHSVFAATLVLATTLAARADVSAQSWLETYYLNPQPDRLPQAVLALSREGYFEKPGNIAIAVGFLGTIFAQHPADVGHWLPELSRLPLKHHRLLASALWQAGHPLGGELMHALAADSPLRAEIQRLADMPSRPVLETAVLSPSSMNLHWGAFLATGDERFVLNIFDAIGLGQPGLDTAARIALARNAATHPRVLEICRAQLERQPAEVSSVLRAALNAAVGTRSGS